MMKSFLILLSLLFVSTGHAAGEISFSPPAPAVVSDDVLLRAIAEVESGNNSAMVGHSGERTRLQIAPETWVRFSRLPHSFAAANPQETDRVARAYLASIRSRLKARGLPATPFFMAAAWNVGPGWNKLPSRTVAYAERVENLVAAGRSVASRSIQPGPAAQVQPVQAAPVVVQSAPVERIPVIPVDDLPAGSPIVAVAASERPFFSSSIVLNLPSRSAFTAPKFSFGYGQ
jgi:hypothetical protein